MKQSCILHDSYISFESLHLYEHPQNRPLLATFFSLLSCFRIFFDAEDGGTHVPLKHRLTTRRCIPEDGILHDDRCENLNSCIFETYCYIQNIT
jgi:hypothetical protein